jgi:hypothetical protein
MRAELIAWTALTIVSIVVLGAVERVLRPGLRGLLDEVVNLPAATTFHLRAFGLVICFTVLSALSEPRFSFKESVRFMEYVWAVANPLKDVFQSLFAVVLIYASLMTVRVAVLRRKT